MLACLVLAVSAVGHDILTIEGLAQPDGELDPLQDAFIEFRRVPVRLLHAGHVARPPRAC